MGNKNITPTLALIFLFSISLTSALVVDADYITIYPGESGKVNIEIENNEKFDIEDVSMQLIMSSVDLNGKIISLPFTIIGSSGKDFDDIDEDDEEDVSFTIKASHDIEPGDYNILYLITYYEEDNNDELTSQGTFGLRVSAKTDLDFSVETREDAIVGEQGKISLEIINMGLGDVKSVSVQIFPEGFELLSKSKIFIGRVSAEDTDLASFDVIYKSTSPVLKAKITYKDFDNNEQIENINLPFRVYTQEQAFELGIIKKSNRGLYIGVVVVLIILWIVYRKIKKARKKKKGR